MGGALEPALAGLRLRFVGGTFASGEADLTAFITKQTGLAPTRIHASGTPAALTTGDLADADVVVLDNLVRVYTPAEAAVLSDWVGAGHGLIVLGGFANDSSAVAHLSSSYGVSYVPGLIANPAQMVSAFSVPALTGGVSSLLFFGGFGLTSSNPNAVAFATIPPDTVGFAITQGAGRVAIWGDDWLLSDQEMTRVDQDNSQPTSVFWTNALVWAAQRD